MRGKNRPRVVRGTSILRKTRLEKESIVRMNKPLPWTHQDVKKGEVCERTTDSCSCNV